MDAPALMLAPVPETESINSCPSACGVCDERNITRPCHYMGRNGLEVMDVIIGFELHKNGFRKDALKYILRADKKGALITDLKKAIQYLQKEIDLRESGEW